MTPDRRFRLRGGPCLAILPAFLGFLLLAPLGARAEPPPLTAAQKDRLKAREPFEQQARKLRGEGKLAESIVPIQKMLAVEREVFGANHDDVATSLTWLAEAYEDQGAFADAARARDEIVAIKTTLYGAKHWKAIDARLAREYVTRLAKLTPEQRQRLKDADAQAAKARQLQGAKQYAAAVDILQNVLQIRKEVLGEESRDYAITLGALGTLYSRLHQYQRSAQFHAQAAAVRRKILGEAHPDYASSLNNVAVAYHDQLDYAKAEPLYRQALEIHRKALGETDSNYVVTLNNLLDLYDSWALQEERAQKFPEAVTARQHALEMKTLRYGANAWQVSDARVAVARAETMAKLSPAERRELADATQLFSKATSLYRERKYREALAPVEQIAAIRKKVLGEQNAEYASALVDVGTLDRLVGQNARAGKALDRARQIRRQLLGENHPDYADVLYELALNASAQGDLSQAASLFRETADIRKKLFGAGNRDYIQAMQALIDLYGDIGQKALNKDDFAAVRDTYDKLASAQAEVYGGDNWRVVTTRLNKAYVETWSKLNPEQRKKLLAANKEESKVGDLIRHGKFKEALQPAEACAQIRKEVLGDSHFQYATSLGFLGLVRGGMGQDERAEELYRQAAAIYRKVAGEQHPYYATMLANLGMIYRQRKDYSAAAGLFREAVAVRTESLGSQDQLTRQSRDYFIEALENSAKAAESRDDYVGAKRARKEALAQRMARDGADNWRTVDARLNLADDELFAGFTPEQRRRLASAGQFMRTAVDFDKQKKYREAAAAVEQALAIRKELLGEHSRRYSDCVSWLGSLYDKLGDYAKSEPYKLQAAALDQTILGDAHPDYATSLNNLGVLYLNEGRYLQAKPLLEQALAIRRKAQGEKDSDYLQTFDTLSDALHKIVAQEEKQADYAAAAKTQQELLTLLAHRYGEGWETAALRRTLLHEQHLAKLDRDQIQRVADSEDTLKKAKALQAQGNYQDALPLAQEAVNVRSQLLGWNDADTEQANECFCALTAASVALPPPAPKSKLTTRQRQRLAQRDQWSERADQLRQKGQLDDAVQAAENMLAIEREVYGDENGEVASSYAYLADLRLDQGEYRAAYDLRKSALAIQTKLHGERSWQAAEERYHANDIADLSRLDADQQQRLRGAANILQQYQQPTGRDERVRELITLQTRAKETVEEVLGKENHYYVSCLLGLSQLDVKNGNYERAIARRREAATILGKIFGKHHPAYLNQLEEVVDLYSREIDRHASRAVPIEMRPGGQGPDANERSKELEKALDLYRLQIEVLKLRYGENNWHVTDARIAMADLQREAGFDEKQLAKLRDLRADEYQDRPSRYGNLERVSDASNVRRLGLCKELFGEDSAHYARALQALGVQASAAGDYDRAVTLLQQALAIRKRVLALDHPDCVETLNELAHACYRRGDFAQAEPLWQEALAILERIHFKTSLAYADILNNLGLIYEALRDFDRAQTTFQDVLEVCRQAGEPNSPDPLTGQHELPRRYQTMLAEFDISGAYRDDNITRPPPPQPPKPPVPAYLNNMAMLFKARGDRRRAESLMRQVLGAIQAQKVDELIPMMREIKDNVVRAEHDAMNDPKYATAASNLGVLYEMSGELDKAEPLLQFAAQERKREYGESHPKYALALNNLGYFYYLRGDRDRAHRYWEQALAIRTASLGEANPQTHSSEANVALLDTLAGHADQAATRLHSLLANAQRTLEATAATQSERQQLVLLPHLRNFLNQYLSLIPAGAVSAEDAYAEVLRWKGIVFARQRQIREQRALASSAPHSDVAQLFRDLEETARQLGTLALGTEDFRGNLRKEIDRLTQKQERLEAELSRRSSEYQALHAVAHLSPRQLQESLPKDTALVDFLVYRRLLPPKDGKGQAASESHVLAFVVRNASPIAAVDLGPEEPIADAIERWRTTSVKRTRAEGSDDPGIVLRRLLWEPLQSYLQDTHTVLVSPDGVLARLPFAALPGSKPGSYLIEETSVAVLAVPQLLPELQKSRAAPAAHDSLVLVGNVDFGADAGTPVASTRGSTLTSFGTKLPAAFKALPGTRDEVTAVRKVYESSHPSGRVHELQGAGATESAFRQQAVACRFLHVATHGFFLPAQPAAGVAVASTMNEATDVLGDDLLKSSQVVTDPQLSCGIVLAGANRPVVPGHDDGILTALEMANLDLSGVDLAVLSACETGLGKLEAGEGVLGLQRALQVAGAGTVIGTLWQIPDEPTRVLMEDFYRNLWDKKLPRLEALRQAQLWMLREGKGHGGVQRGLEAVDDAGPDQSGRLPPYYWAAFILSGDWR